MRFYYRPGHPRASPGGFVSEKDLEEIPMEAPQAKNAPIITDKAYEGMKHSDGTDISTRQKHREFMKENGLAMACDYSPEWFQKRKAKDEREYRNERRDVLKRKMWEIDKP